MPADPMAQTAIILASYPQLSQTFIYRELVAMQRHGEMPLLVGLRHVPDQEPLLEPEVREVSDRVLSLGSPTLRFVSGLVRGPLREPRFAGAAAHMLRLPHRTLGHRARAVSALTAAARLAPLLRARGIRYVHAHFAGFATEVAMALSHLMRVPYGATWHAFGIYRDRNALVQKIAGARVVLTCTGVNQRHLQELAPEHAERIVLAYHGIPLADLAPTPIADDAEPRVLSVGRMVEKKGFGFLMDAIGTLARQGVPVRLELVGDGPLRGELRAQARRLGIAQRVDFLGTLPNREVLARMHTARVIAVPSVRGKDGDIDGIPNVLLEAMASARPVVASEVSAIPEAVHHGENGMLVAPGDADGLAAALRGYLESTDAADEAGRRGREVAEAMFDLDRTVPQMVEALRAAATGR